MTDPNKDRASQTPAGEEEDKSRFSELDELEAQIRKRIRDNERFLERFMDDDYKDDDEIDGDEDDDIFEEL